MRKLTKSEFVEIVKIEIKKKKEYKSCIIERNINNKRIAKSYYASKSNNRNKVLYG